MTTMTSMMNSAGIAILENFSIPPDTPPMTMSTVRTRKNTPNKIAGIPLLINPPKNASASTRPVPQLAPKMSPKFAIMYLIT